MEVRQLSIEDLYVEVRQLGWELHTSVWKSFVMELNKPG